MANLQPDLTLEQVFDSVFFPGLGLQRADVQPRWMLSMPRIFLTCSIDRSFARKQLNWWRQHWLAVIRWQLPPIRFSQELLFCSA